MTANKIAKAFLVSILFACVSATSSFAELANMQDKPATEEKTDSGIKALIGISGGNSLVADDGAIFTSLRIGLSLNTYMATGAWFSMLLGDIRNYNVPQKQMINYKAFGAFVELFPLRFDAFSISVPIQAGGGAVHALDNGDEAFESEEYFFTADMAVHFNYRITRMLEVSIGGGYRMFTGIDENNLENLDFCTPFGELRFTIKE